MVEFDLGGVEGGQEGCGFVLHGEQDFAMPRNMDGEDGGRARLLSKLHTPSKAELERHVVSHMPFRDWCRHCVVGKTS